MAEWYYAKGDNEHGPVSNSELKQLANEGKLLPTDLVWKEGAPEWKPASIVRDLFPEEKQSSTPRLPSRPPVPKTKVEPNIPDTRPSNVSAKWYQHPAAIVVSLLFCFPVGLILVWTHRNWSMKHKWIWTGSFATVVLLFGLANLGEDPAATGTSTKNGNLQSAAIFVTAERLTEEYEANEVAADEKYKGKILEVTGTIKEIGKDVFGQLYVSLENGQSISLLSVDCYFDDNLNEKMASLSKGRQITIRGRCDSGNSIRNCEFVNPESAIAQEQGSVDSAAVRDQESTGTPANDGEPDSNNDATIVVTAERLSAEYAANEIAADDKYKGKIVEVTGIIQKIGKDVFNNKTYVALEVGQRLGFYSIECFIGDNLRKEAASLSKGSLITIRGRCQGKRADIRIENCEFIKTEAKRDEGASGEDADAMMDVWDAAKNQKNIARVVRKPEDPKPHVPVHNRKTIHRFHHLSENLQNLRWMCVDSAEAKLLENDHDWTSRGILGYGLVAHEPGTHPLWRYYDKKTGRHRYFLSQPTNRREKKEGLLAWVWSEPKPGMILVKGLEDAGGSMQLENDERIIKWLIQDHNWRVTLGFYVYPILGPKPLQKNVRVVKKPGDQKPQSKPKYRSIYDADEGFMRVAIGRGERTTVIAKMLIEFRRRDRWSWKRLQGSVDFQFGAIKNEFKQWKQDCIAAGGGKH